MSLPRYGEYKRGGESWLSELPSHWDLTPLKHLVDLRSGGTPSKENTSYWDGDVPWASAKDLKVDQLGATGDCITQHAIDSGAASLVPTGAVLVVVRGMILAKTFPVSETLRPMAINQDLKAVVVREKLVGPFLAWLLRGTAKESLLRLDEAGHGTKALRMEAWTSIKLPVPPVIEQATIATFLNRETAKIDALIAEQEKLIALLAEKRQATISHAVTKGLDPRAPMKDSGVVWLGEVPAHWEVQRIKRLVTSIEQGWSPQCENSPVSSAEEWGVLKVGCVNGGAFQPAENKKLPPELEPVPAYSLRRGDLLISRANTRDLVGSAAAIEADFANLMLCDKLYRLRLAEDLCAPPYLAAYLGTPQARSQIELQATGASSSMLNIGQSAILDLFAPVPSSAEQVEILQFLSHETKRLDALNACAEQAIALLKERRSALIAAAVTGQIDVQNA